MAQRPAALGDCDLASLDPFLRALLTVDGTVTPLIEAYTLEPVQIDVLDQAPAPAGWAAEWLDCAAADRALRRRSALSGAYSGRLYARAESVVVPDRLTAPMRDALREEPGGLGRILLTSGLETRREGLWYGREAPPDHSATVVADACLVRTYRVIAAGRPIMLITERFPLTLAR
jgi:chorismate-pyruvate lyase